MKLSDIDLVFRLHNRSDSERIVTMINRDPCHMLNGITVEAFEQLPTRIHKGSLCCYLFTLNVSIKDESRMVI
ncbi:hypothetical protein DQG23_38535 [Paenibacillus contaminans]|uniref:Uncharacterized protein n=1 Tax=Paenibacillus contaminans TaxID=450362 RepID=A0A329LSK6_9BACL|nr:hypothetical protein DQG23_38535 [Paenibacillus contaminans]